MRAAIQHIEGASEELTKLQEELVVLEQRIQTVQRILQHATEALPSEEQPSLPAPRAAFKPTRLIGRPRKVNAEVSARVQQALRLETKKEAEVAVGSVIDALEYCLLRNLGIDGFSLKLGSFGKFKVRHLKPTIRKVGFSGETVTTKTKRRIKFVRTHTDADIQAFRTQLIRAGIVPCGNGS